jgi:hypothetical protein
MRPVRGFVRRFRFACARMSACKFVWLAILLLCSVSFVRSVAHAQGRAPLITVATDQSTSGSVSNQFGVPAAQAVDQAGDLVFIGRGGSALFFRAAGAASATTRLLQTGDQVPGFPGSHVMSFPSTVSMNSSGKIIFAVAYSLPDALPHQALLTYNTGSGYQNIVSSDDPSPAGGGAYGTSLLPLNPGAINDNGDVAFTAAPTITSAFTLYIAPAAGTPLRIVANGDFLPYPSGYIFLNIFPSSGLNSLGQVLFFAETTQGSGFFLATAANGGQILKVVTAGDPICGGSGSIFGLTVVPGAALSDTGTYAFAEQTTTQSAICFGAAGGTLTKAVGTGTAAPAAIGGMLGLQSFRSPLAIDSSGDIVFSSAIAGSATTGFALLSFQPSSGQLDVVAYTGEPAPGTTSNTFTGNFSPFSVSRNGTVAFTATLTGNGTGIYQQAGTAAPSLVALSGKPALLSSGGTFTIPSAIQQLDNGSLFFSSQVEGGTAYYGLFIDTAGSLQPLMSTADTLPSGSQVSLLYGSPQASGDFVGFGAQRAGGKISLFSSNSATGTTKVAVSDGDTFPATGGVIFGPDLNYFLNGNGQIVFSSNLVGGSSSNAILLSSPGSGLSKVAAVGDVTPFFGTTFSTLTLNSGPPSPFNNAGQVAFGGTYGPVGTGSGVFLFSPAGGGSVAKIAATGDSVVTSAGTGTLNDVGITSIALNQSGTVAFYTFISIPSPSAPNQFGFFSGSGGAVSKIAMTGDSTQNGVLSSVGNILSFSDSGSLLFNGSVTGSFLSGGWSVLTGIAGTAPSVAAYSGEAAPGGGQFVLSTSTTISNVTFISTSDNALQNNQGDVTFRSFVAGGAINSGIFLIDGTGSKAGILRTGISQGEPVPLGGNLALSAITPTTNFVIGPDGQVATVANYGPNSNPTNQGMFFLRKNGTLARVLAAGDTVLGGGVLSGIQLNQNLAAGAAGKFAFWAQMDGGSVHQAVLSTAGVLSTAVTLSSSPNPDVVGLPATITATVSTTSTKTPTGTVTFFDNSVSLATQPLDAAGNATLITSALVTGSHSMTARYNGDTNFPSSSSAVLVEVILASGTSPNITSASNATFPVGAASSFTVTATGVPVPTVSLSGSLPSGVTFNSSTGALSGTPPAEASGIYLLTISAHNGVLHDAVQNFKLTVSATPGTWALTAGSLTQTRAGHTATLLINGKVLLAGGTASSPNHADLYDPVTGTFTSTGSMVSVRYGHTATLLNDGRVLLAGGSDGSSSVPLATAELYDPSTGTFTATGTMTAVRNGHTATLLRNGKVLIAGGSSGFGSVASTELYDPASGIFTANTSMLVARDEHTATLMDNGKVLIVGGGTNNALATSEIYDAVTATFTPSGTMATPRYGHSATLMNNNKVLILYGFNGTSAYLANPELYDVATGTFSSLSGLTTPLINHTATLLTDGTVLIAGGFDGTNSLTAVHLYDPATGTFSNTGSLSGSRASHTATLLNTGKVLVAGGEQIANHGGTFLSSAELYEPAVFTPPGLVSIAVTPVVPSLLQGGAQTFVATGTFSGSSSQTLAAAVWSSSDNLIATITDDVSNRGTAYVLAATGSPTITACAGSICGSTSLTINPAPNFVSAPLATFLAGTPGAFAVKAFGTPAPTFSETGALPSGVTLDTTGLLNGTPAAGTGGTYAFTITAHNGVLPDASQAFTLTVNESPKITSAPSGAFTLGVPGSFPVTAYGFPLPTFSETGPLPFGVSFNASTHLLSGTPLGSIGGVYVIAFTAQNGILPDDTQTFTLTVQQPPAITSVAAKGFTLGVPGSFTVTATGVPAPTFSESGALPAGVTFNGITGVLSGAPTVTKTGDYPIIITAQNGALPNAVQNFVLSVTSWVSTGSMGSARGSFTATALASGKILVVGGRGSDGNAVTNAELYDPATGTFAPTGSMAFPRYSHTATLLNNGQVLIAGGFTPTSIAELYDPATGVFSQTGAMSVNRENHTATMLNNGTVLMAGGISTLNLPGSFASAEVYDPTTGQFTVVGNMTAGRAWHTATLLNNGKVLIAGGRTNSVSGGTYWASAELYDPVTSTFSATGSLSTARAFQVATILNDGTVLLTGGINDQIFWLASAELYDPVAATFNLTGSMVNARFDHTQTLLNNGDFLVAGGNGPAGVLSSAELYDVGTKQFSAADTMLNTRGAPAAILLNNGKVLVAGGYDGNFSGLASTELYPSTIAKPQGLVSIAVTPSSPLIPVGSSVKLTATGTFSNNSTEQLSSVIWSSSNNAAVPVTNDSTNRGVAYALAPTQSVTITGCAGSICGSSTIEAGTAAAITSPNSATFTVNTTGSFTVVATGVPTPTLSETGVLPAGVTFNSTTGVLSGVPAAGTVGTYGIHFTAHNGIGNDAVQVFLLTVFGVPPVITSAPTTTFTVGTFTSFAVTATGTPAPTFSESGAPPAGVMFDTSTGVLSGTPAPGTTGNYVLTLTAQNGALPNATQIFTLSVTPWVPTGSLITGVDNHVAVLLNTGKVLIAGGYSGSGAVAPAQLYDPATGSFATTGSMTTARYSHRAVLLNSGKVLITGGLNAGGIVLSSAEIYDPMIGTFTPTGNMTSVRFEHAATVLNDGRVLVTGGLDQNSSSLASAELYNPATGAFTATSPMSNTRADHTSTLLNSGLVLITGASGGGQPSADLYDPASGKFAVAGNMTINRTHHTATLLNNGKVLITGGYSSPYDGVVSAELYDPATGTFALTGSMTSNRYDHTATLLNNGTVLIAGGNPSTGTLLDTEAYDPSTGTFSFAGHLTDQRIVFTATLLPDGNVLIAGGFGGTIPGVLATTELYPPSTLAPPGLVSIAVTPASPVIQIGSSVKLTATGTFNDSSSQQLSSVSWRSSNNAAVSVTNDSTNRGVAYAVAPTQSATITGCAGLICGSATIEADAAPVITSANSAAFTIGALGSFTVTATGFPTPSFLESGTLPSGIAFNTSTGVLAGTPAAGIEGTYNLTFTAHNGVGSDAVQNFTLSVVPVPVISSFTPGSDTIVLGGSTTLTPVFSNGTGSVDNGIGAVSNGVARTVTPTSTTTYTLTVTNVAGTSVTATAKVTVNNPIPTITSLSPSHSNAGAAISTLTVNGANFVSGAAVSFNGKSETTTFVSATQLTATVPAADNALGGSLQVSATNPAPGGGTSAGQTFTADSFTATIQANAATVTAGQPAQYSIIIAPTTNGFSNTVTLGATGLPQGTAAMFSQNSVAAGNTVTMTVTTTARSSVPPRRRVPVQRLRILQTLEIASVLLAILGLISFRRQRRWVTALPTGALLVCLTIAYGCTTGGTSTGGGSGGTPSGTYKIAVTATSGTFVQTTQVTLTVN